jgi:secernin
MCDTIVATKEATRDGSVILAKNSDREPNEAQHIEYHPAQEFAAGQQLKVTYISIDQARQTRAVLLSRPFWMWGAEMGANDAGVAIGNEAVFTKLPMRKEKLLLGMDLLRLALERAGSADEALDVITKLLARYGQGGPAGYEDKKFAYHNSFIIADPKGAWVLETADREWAAKRITGVYSISNGLTIGERFDKASPKLVSTALEKGWTKSEADFEFARDYSDWFFTTFSMCHPRAARTTEMVSGRRGSVDSRSMMALLRDHRGEGPGHDPSRGLFMNKVCMHAANGLSRASQTTGSLVCHLTGDVNTHWITGTAAPCTSIFKPFFFEGEALPDVGPQPAGNFNNKNLWWAHERLHRAILMDYPTRMAVVAAERDRLEDRFVADGDKTVAQARKLSGDGRKKILADFSQGCFAEAWEAEGRWVEAVAKTPVSKRPSALFRSYWNKQNRKAGLDL